MTEGTLRRLISRLHDFGPCRHETNAIEDLPMGGIGRKVHVPAAIEKGAAV
jgi:hypothetical protein